MRRSAQSSPESPLFDLPLVVARGIGETEAEPTAPTAPSSKAEQIELPEQATEAALASATAKDALVRRTLAGIIDLTILGGALGVLVIGALSLGASTGGGAWLGHLLALVDFSFVYAVFSLTFWGRTPGMARAKLVARAPNGDPLSSGQATRRWLGGLATVALLGLPMLLLLRGEATLTDRLSGTRVGA